MPQFTTENVCYLKHGAREIMARVYKPEGDGPVPGVIDLHGGAWNNGDLTPHRRSTNTWRSTALSWSRWTSAMPRTAIRHRCIDINYAIRWVKAHAKD